MKAILPKGPKMGNPQELLRKMQEDMENLQEELNARSYTINAGGGAVSITITGEKVITDLKIDPMVIDPEDPETLQDIIIAGVNEAINKVETTNNEEMAKISNPLGSLGLGI